MPQNTQHTPGPWEITTTIYPNHTVYGVRNAEWGNPNPYPSEPLLGMRWTTRKKADALLIAAAPDLMEACQFAHDLLLELTTESFEKGGDKPARDKLAAALAKAGVK